MQAFQLSTTIRKAPLSRSVVAKADVINQSVRKEEPKVVDTLKAAEEKGKKMVLCRCWKSKTFPKCDGTHAKHNEETGDNVGPVIVDLS